MLSGRAATRERALWVVFAVAGCAAVALTNSASGADCKPSSGRESVRIGAYYFDGWATDRFVTERMAAEFADREPIWGWRDDSLQLMERQIDLAADSGLAFFAFCWYWHDDGTAIEREGDQE